MGRKKETQILDVYLNTLKVGELKKDTSGLTSFLYDDLWLSEGIAISNSMPLQEDEYKGEVVARYFDNLLPDNEQIKEIVATKFGAESKRPFDLLSVIGRDCVGALSFVRQGEDYQPDLSIKMDQLSDEQIAHKLRELGKSSPLGMSSNDFRLSIAGAQEKTALLQIDNKWYEPRGLTPTTHIIKTSIGALGEEISFDDSIDNEWASLYIMRKLGLETCETSISNFEDQRALIVKRFDRIWKENDGKKIILRRPQEDLCQAFGVSPYKKYQSDGGIGIKEISQFLNASDEREDKEKFFRAIIIFDLLYATDGHAKNFSVFLTRTSFKLTPFYDVMSSYFLYKREGRALQSLKLAMKVGDSGYYAFKRIRRRHYEQTAKQCGINSDRCNSIIDDVLTRFRELNITQSELDKNLNQDTLNIILEGMNKRARLFKY
ncbi:MAG: HipA domain-containing protein [Bacteriovoracaceae bacterium]|jgi:serine/threonine-protein kinase HipA|nr:HipA domain-containing protein [Bacteriovoracaceae bacterium]